MLVGPVGGVVGGGVVLPPRAYRDPLPPVVAGAAEAGVTIVCEAPVSEA